jgi:site-specific DNA-methyltransferase (cytosine-N4-specific)
LLPESKLSLVAFSTKLGVAIWGNCKQVFSDFDEPISLCLSSPPYPLRNPRAYGNVDTSEYTDFICESLESIVKNLKDGGSIALNVSNDIFMKGSPARSIYLEKLTIAIVQRLGLHLMDRIIWQSNKPPGPTQWASVNRVQLNVGYEHVLWFTNNPAKVFSNNQRVLQPHTDKHMKLVASGGEKREGNYSDGAHKIRNGSYSNPTAGRIPTNVINIANTCQSQREYKSTAKNLGLPTHGAPMPLKLASMLIQFLTPEPANDTPVIVDPFGGSLTVPLAAELLGRQWITTDIIWEYLRGGVERFRKFDAELNPIFSSIRADLI